MYSIHYRLNTEINENYVDVMERHGISYEQYEAVRRNLFRIGLLTTETDLNIEHDLKEVNETFEGIIFSYIGVIHDCKC